MSFFKRSSKNTLQESLSMSRTSGLVLLCAISQSLLMNSICYAADEPASDAVVIRGTTGKSLTLTVDELKKLPKVDLEVTDRKGQPVKYSGVAISTLLSQVDAAQGESLRGEWLRAFVTVDARDDYRAVFALPEFDPEFTDRVIILAYERDGKPLDASSGPCQIIVPNEKRHARWVRMVRQIRVLDSAWVKDKE